MIACIGAVVLRMTPFKVLTMLVLTCAYGCKSGGRTSTTANPDSTNAATGDSFQPAADGAISDEPEEVLPDRVSVADAALGPGDEIRITVYRHPDLAGTFNIPRSGTIFLPLAGEINVGGVSALDLRRLITERLNRYLVDPQVTVGVTVRRSQKVLVLGEVVRPGLFIMNEPMSVLESIVMAGGFTEQATKRKIIVLRSRNAQTATHFVNLDRTLKKGDFVENIELQRGDVVYVPKSVVANIDKFARHLVTWLSPIIQSESATILGWDIYDRINDSGSESNIFIGGN